MMERDCDEEGNESKSAQIKKSEHQSYLSEAKKMLVKLESFRDNIEEELQCKKDEETETLNIISSHAAECHAQLELVEAEAKAGIQKAEEKRKDGQKNCMKKNLPEIVFSNIDPVCDVQLVIDESIFSSLENHLRIEKSKALKEDDSSEVFAELDPVEITWINSPSDFYVVKLSDLDLLERMEDEMKLLVEECVDSKKAIVAGDIIAVEERNTMLRARVSSVDDCQATVTYIDEGNEGHHPLAELHPLPAELSSVPGLAHNCSLSGIIPPDNTWSQLASRVLARVTDTQVCLVGRSSKDTPTRVTMYLQAAVGVSLAQRSSLSSYLVYKGLAMWDDVNTEVTDNYQECFTQISPPKEGSKHIVMVSHVEDPGHVFVQFGYTQYIAPLTELITSTYRERKEEMQVLVPRVGMNCIACIQKLGGQEIFLRAQVTAMQGDGRVEVVCVDYGFKEVIEDSEIFQLLDRFLTLPVMAVPVCLDRIGSLQSKKHVAQVLIDRTWSKELTMFVSKKNLDDLTEVMLYEVLEDVDVSVNDWLVNEGQYLALTSVSYTMSTEMLDNLVHNSLFDSHCHLDFILLQRLSHLQLESFDQFVERYPLINHPSLEGCISNFCSPELWLRHMFSPSPLVLSLLSSPSVFYTIGCHPHFAPTLLLPDIFQHLETLIKTAGPSFVAIGECGLDRSGKNKVKMSDQIEAFKKQLELAMRLKLPLVLHIRDAEEEALNVLEEVGLPSDWPIHRHCWNDTWDVCRTWMERFTNSVVGITALITFPHQHDLRKVAMLMPLDRLVLETDAPYFLPRGGGGDGLLGHTTSQFSLPVHVANVAAQVAAIRDCTVEEVLKANRRNIKRIYKI